MIDELINSAQLAEKLRTSQVTVARMRTDGTGPKFLKIGRSVKYRWSDVEVWLAGLERLSTSEVTS